MSQSIKEGILWNIARRLRPELNHLEEPLCTLRLLEVLPVIFAGPFALVALVWLVAATNTRLIVDQYGLLAALFAAMWVMQQRLFVIYIELAPNELIPITGSMSNIVTWSAALIFGPTALWLPLLVNLTTVFQTVRQARRHQQPVLWQALSNFSQTALEEIFACLLGLAVYHAAGGVYPLAEVDPKDWLPTIAASLIAIELPLLIMLPVILYLRQLGAGGLHSGGVFRWWIVLSVFTLGSVGPSSLLAALIYSQTSLTLFGLFMAGIVVISFLIYYLSRTNERSQQRARELARLEVLGEALIQAPPDLSTLTDLLRQHIESMFPQDRVEVRLFAPGGTLPPGLHWPDFRLTLPPNRPPLPDSAWERLRQPGAPSNAPPEAQPILLPKVIPPDLKIVYGDAVLVRIMADDPGKEGGEKERMLGGICLLRSERQGKPTYSLAAVQSLASQIGSAFYRAAANLEALSAHKMSRELEVAGQIQARFLPRHIPSIWGWDIAAALDPARQTSGDFYDFIELDNGHLGLVIADVADKGTGAALYMALSRTLIRTFALQNLAAPGKVFSAANERLLTDAESDQFVTAFYGELSPLTGVLTYASAGHNPAFLIRGNGEASVEMLEKTGVPLGMFEGMAWHQGETHLDPGDVLVLYTDGVNEAQNAAGEEFRNDRLLDAVLAHRDRPAQEIRAALMSAVTEFVGDAPQFDDVTVVIVARR